jgi:uncharacterized membrane protein
MFFQASNKHESVVSLSEGEIMRTPASIGGHPIHPMLIVFPVGLLIFSLICDLVAFFSAHPENWILVAFYTMVGGFIGALAAAIPGLIDLVSMTDTRIKRIAITHMSLNLIAVALYAVNIWARYTKETHSASVVWLSVAAVAILAVSGWLGGEMVHRHGVGVDSDESSERPVFGATTNATSGQTRTTRA